MSQATRDRLRSLLHLRALLDGWLGSGLIAGALFVGLGTTILGCGIWMPGRSLDVEPPASAEEQARTERLRAHTEALATRIGERNRQEYEPLVSAREYVVAQLEAAGYAPEILAYDFDGDSFANIEAVHEGPEPSVVIGAHYDSAEGSPGGNDNASGVAVLIELARELKSRPLGGAVRFVAFTNEEPPYFNTGLGMGSAVYVNGLAARSIEVRAMLSLDSVGYYDSRPGSQNLPPILSWLYPSMGDYIAVVGEYSQRSLVRSVVEELRKAERLKVEGLAVWGAVPGITWSDHRSFTRKGIPAVLVTDTATKRDPFYHTRRDTPERLDHERMSRLVTALARAVETLARSQ